MLVHAFVAAIGTTPEPAVFSVFNRIDEIFANFVGCSFRVAVFA